MMDCGAVSLAASVQHIEAECAFGPAKGACTGALGGQTGTSLEPGDVAVGYIEAKDTLWYSKLPLDGMTTLKVHYAKETSGGSLEIHLDSATGTLLGTITPAATGAWTTWGDASATLPANKGAHDIYLVAAGGSGGIMNLDWLELSPGGGTASPVGAPKAFHLNHVGYDTLGPKHIVVEGPANLDKFNVVGEDGKSAWCGTLKAQSFTTWGSTQTSYSVDFTGLTKAGTYRLQVGSGTSDAFVIGDNRLFTQTFPSVLGYFKNSRADDAEIWAADAKVPFVDGSGSADVRGGWYDASGDLSKYLSHLSYANFLNPQQIPLVAWSLAWVRDEGGAALKASGKATAVQEEAVWGADYLLRVLDPAGFFYINVFDNWSGITGDRKICAFEGQDGATTAAWQSAMREGGGMSIAALARVGSWKVDGSFPSAKYLAGAEAAFAVLNTSGSKYADDGKENVIDDYTGLLAASELYAATQKATYLEAARARATSLKGRLSPTGYFIADGAARPFWHASDAGLPVVALARYVQVETDETQRKSAQETIRTHLTYLLKVSSEVANPYGYARQHVAAGTADFFIPHKNESGYWWQGENARLGSLAAAAVIGAKAIGATGDQYLEYLRYAGTQVDWVLGSNPFDICFLHGAGKNNPPAYSGDKALNGTLDGGISNGITSQASDGTGIQWMLASKCDTNCWENWRWVEQWIPHSAWYMVATTALTR